MLANWNWLEFLRQLAIIVTLAAGGGGAVWFVQWLKARLGWNSAKALTLAGVVSVVVAVAGMIAGDELGVADLRVENLSNIVIGVFVASQAIYHGIVSKLG